MPYDMSTSLPYDSPVVVENPAKTKNYSIIIIIMFNLQIENSISFIILFPILNYKQKTKFKSFLLELATSDWATVDAGVLFNPDWGAELGGWGRT